MSDPIFSPKKVSPINTRNRRLRGWIPARGTSDLFDSLSNVESRSMHGQIPFAWSRARESTVWDLAGNKFIDFTSSIFVANVGHSNKKVLQAVSGSMRKGLISTYSYPTSIREKYLSELIRFAGEPFEKAFLLSAGTEATDAVFKLIKMHGSNKIGYKPSIIIAFEGNWHGRTMGAQLLSSNVKQKEWITDGGGDIVHLPFPLPWEVAENEGQEFFQNCLRLLSDKGYEASQIAGFVLESFQGWGALFYPNSFVQAIDKFCKSNNSLLAFDEMQSGFGRTGADFGFQHYGVKPDLIAVGKGMGGGFPLSGVLGRKEIMDLPDVGNMSSTHSANPIVCSAGLAVIREIESRQLSARSAELGKILQNRLERIQKENSDIIESVQGKGLIAAIIFRESSQVAGAKTASEVVAKCLRMGLLLVHTGRESIKIGPPLVISKNALEEGLEILETAIQTQGLGQS